MLCVLGIQWSARLIAVPLGKTNLERTLARERRKAIADGYMLPLMGLLFWTLLLAIGFFVLGFLIQLWALSVSFSGPAPILLVGGALATAISLVILGIVVATTVHASLHENSPFESPLSNAMRPLLHRMGLRVSTADPSPRKDAAEHYHESFVADDDIDDVAALVKWNGSDAEEEEVLKTYARLVIETSDAEVLERAVPSFDFEAWYSHIYSLAPAFHAVRRRFLSTDTSFRVKETVYKQLVPSKNWSLWTEDWKGQRIWKDELDANILTHWCKDHYQQLVGQSREAHRTFFVPWVFFTSLEEANQNLRGLRPERYEECMGRILCMCSRGWEVADRAVIFQSAINECRLLLRDGRSDIVTAILFHTNRSSLLQSFMRNPSVGWYHIEALVSFMTKGAELDILDEMSYYLSNLTGLIIANEDLLMRFLAHLASKLPTDFTVPSHLDLSHILELIVERNLIKRYGDTLIYYLNHGGFERLSDLHPASSFMEACLNLSRAPLWWHSMPTTPAMLAFHQQHQACFARE